MISPAVRKQDLSFHNFNYIDPAGERHWDLSQVPTTYGDMEHCRKDFCESPSSKKFREAQFNKK